MMKRFYAMDLKTKAEKRALEFMLKDYFQCDVTVTPFGVTLSGQVQGTRSENAWYINGILKGLRWRD